VRYEGNLNERPTEKKGQHIGFERIPEESAKAGSHHAEFALEIKRVASDRKSANRANRPKGKPAERDLQIEIVSRGSGENVSPMMEAKAAVSGDGQEEREKLKFSSPPNALSEGAAGILLLD
jgi:hypothetical protein